MIQDGETFNVFQLKESVAQATAVDLIPHIKFQPQRLPLVFADRDTMVDIRDLTPETYADLCINLFPDLPSSAKKLDKCISQAGYRTTYKFSHNYHIPGLTHDQIAHDAYKLEYFYKLAVLGATPKNNKSDLVWQALDDASRVSYYYAQYIWATNPDTRFDYPDRLDPYLNWGLVLSFLQGTGFHFHPNDVYEFIAHHNAPNLSKAQLNERYKQQKEFQNWCTKFGIDTGCLVLCPQHQEKLRKILTQTDTPYIIQLLQRAFSWTH